LHLGMKLTLTYTDSYFYVTTIINMQPHIEWSEMQQKGRTFEINNFHHYLQFL
jgi:hypothetical protein